tara:strand:+ start:44 stop:610 length:567 start_codon:yes stop_codon:yes gene_type:complete
MADIKALLELKKKIKAKRPRFIRQDTHAIKRIEVKWRKPKGVHSKMRHKIKSKRSTPSPGYRSPAKVRGLIDGLGYKIVYNVGELKNIDKEKVGIIIGATVGKMKKVEIIKSAKNEEIKILNIDGDEYIKKFEEFVEKKKKVKDEKKVKEEKKKEKKVKEEKKVKDESVEDKLKEEKKEKDKVLIKKE